MDYLLLGRVAKVAALLGFVLPWVTVSCSGTEILTATGVQLMTGDPQPAGPLAGQEAPDREAEPAVMVILAFIVLLVGLGASFLPQARGAAAALLLGGALGAGLTYYSVQNMKTELARELGEAENQDMGGMLSREQSREMSQAMASAIRVEKQEGYWLTLAAALLGGLMGLIVLAGAGGRRDQESVSAPDIPPTP